MMMIYVCDYWIILIISSKLQFRREMWFNCVLYLNRCYWLKSFSSLANGDFVKRLFFVFRYFFSSSLSNCTTHLCVGTNDCIEIFIIPILVARKKKKWRFEAFFFRYQYFPSFNRWNWSSLLNRSNTFTPRYSRFFMYIYFILITKFMF